MVDNRRKRHRQGPYLGDFYVGIILGLLAGIMVGCWLCATAVAADEDGKPSAEAPEFSGVKPIIYMPQEPVEPEEPEIEEPEQPQPVSIGWYKITAYCPCQKCCGKTPDNPWYGITATGTRATQGRTIAVDPSVIGLGSSVYFEGPDGVVTGYVAEDTGGAIKGNRIDLYFDSHQEALEWGIRELEVFVIND